MEVCALLQVDLQKDLGVTGTRRDTQLLDVQILGGAQHVETHVIAFVIYGFSDLVWHVRPDQ